MSTDNTIEHWYEYKLVAIFSSLKLFIYFAIKRRSTGKDMQPGVLGLLSYSYEWIKHG